MCVSVLVANGAEIYQTDKVMLYASLSERVRYLYEQHGETALMMAAGMGHHRCVSNLVANGADVNFAMKVIEVGNLHFSS